ncbi:MAG: hypothetical protein JWL61_3680 [Gemmatimonadetes bacterium]|nr:hypothetical protein [Gemmatimonadota bacterium]
MPGYRSLPTSLTAPGADGVRQAESSYRGGDPTDAARLLEEALEASAQRDPVLPGWLCGRLAALYRTLERHDDEVFLLERYRESQVSEEARTRYDARLTKARAIAFRKRKGDGSGALESVRAIIQRPRRSRTRSVRLPASASAFSPRVVNALACALATGVEESAELSDAIGLLCVEAHAHKLPAEEVVALLRRVSATAAARHRDADSKSRYDSALLLTLSRYYGGAQVSERL